LTLSFIEWSDLPALLILLKLLTFVETFFILVFKGQVSEQNCYWNIEAAYKFLVEVRNIPPESIILYGRSVGSGPTCYLAAKTASEGRSVGGVILHSPFLSVCRVAVDAGFSLPGDLFRNLDQAPKIRCPVFIIHGTSDTVVPFWHGQELLMHVPAEYRAPPFWAEGMGHNGIELFMRQTYFERVSTFILKYIASSVGVPIPPQPIPEIDRADVEVGERSPCTVRLNFTWLGAGPLVRRRGKNESSALRRKNADVAEQNNGENGTTTDENAGPSNEEDNRTLYTEMNDTLVQGADKVNENTLNSE